MLRVVLLILIFMQGRLTRTELNGFAYKIPEFLFFTHFLLVVSSWCFYVSVFSVCTYPSEPASKGLFQTMKTIFDDFKPSPPPYPPLSITRIIIKSTAEKGPVRLKDQCI